MGTTLETAINNETATTSGEKTTQLAFLSASAKALEQADLEKILKKDFDGLTGVSTDDIHDVNDLAVWRIENDYPILPFTGLDLTDAFVMF